jgi:hypothetical protein
VVIEAGLVHWGIGEEVSVPPHRRKSYGVDKLSGHHLSSLNRKVAW